MSADEAAVVASAATTTARDGCAVETAPLAALVRGFVTSWNRQRPQTANRYGEEPGSVTPIGAYEYLAAETRRADLLGRGVPEPTIENIVRELRPTTPLSVADALVTAIDRPEAFYDGTLEIRPNPGASKQARAACCTGSSPPPASLTG